MSGKLLETLERLLETGRDDALLRFGLGNEYLKQGRATEAVAHLRLAVEKDPTFSAAWKALGQALTETHAHADAQASYREGIAAADRRGDIQAAKEMRVFLKRLERMAAPNADTGPPGDRDGS